MHSLYLLSLTLSLYLHSSSALPVAYDLDGNGIQDFCTFDLNGNTVCLSADNSLTTIATAVATSTPNIPGPATTSSVQALITPATPATGSLPAPQVFQALNGTSWNVEFVGNLQFTGSVQEKGLGGDKCRSSVLGGQTIWNCGDMECGMSQNANDGDWSICGFAMGPAFYGTDSVMTVDTSNVSLVQYYDFAQAWIWDAPPEAPQTHWGMDTSNIAAINDTHGVAYIWEIWRGALDGSYVDRGAGVVSVTLGDDRPIATRMGPLISGPESAQLGLFAILSDGGYVYSYTMGGPTGMMVGRVTASDDVFDVTKYEFLSASDFTTWTAPGSIPSNTTLEFGMQNSNDHGQFSCNVYGSVFWSPYLNKYVMVCTLFMAQTNMYTADYAWGPWSSEYQLLTGWGQGYGAHAHPQYSEQGGKVWYFSQGPNGPFDMFKVTLP